MERMIPASEAGESFGTILEDVQARGDWVIVERDGTPVAAVVPIDFYERWKRTREAYFARMEAAAARASLSEEADALVAEAVRAVRASAGE
jgi:prevent-host-death family protein